MELREIACDLAERGDRVGDQSPRGVAVGREAGKPLESADVKSDFARSGYGHLRRQELDVDASQRPVAVKRLRGVYDRDAN